MDYAMRMSKSENKVDRRLINLYLLNRVNQKGIHFGFGHDAIRINESKRKKLRHEPSLLTYNFSTQKDMKEYDENFVNCKSVDQQTEHKRKEN